MRTMLANGLQLRTHGIAAVHRLIPCDTDSVENVHAFEHMRVSGCRNLMVITLSRRLLSCSARRSIVDSRQIGSESDVY